MTVPPVLAGGYQLMTTCPLPGIAVTSCGAAGTVAVTVATTDWLNEADVLAAKVEPPV